jgi:hypothetical protein
MIDHESGNKRPMGRVRPRRQVSRRQLHRKASRWLC